MNYFEMTYDNATNYLIRAIHQYCVPGIICNVCNSSWLAIGLQYPKVNINESCMQYKDYYSRPKPYQWAVHHEMKPATDKIFNDLFVLPGTRFGPLRGIAHWNGYDFAWPNPWTPLISFKAYQQLKEQNINLPAIAPTQIRMSDQSDFKYYEFQIHAKAALMDSNVKTCKRCGKNSITKPDHLKISIVPEQLDEEIFRIKELPEIIIVTENFKKAVEKLKLQDICFKKVKQVQFV